MSSLISYFKPKEITKENKVNKDKTIVDYGAAGKKREGEIEFISYEDATNGLSSKEIGKRFSYFKPYFNNLGKREIISNPNLYNQENFVNYWGNKVDKNRDWIELYKANDLDGDGYEDYLAYNKAQQQFVGFNDKIIVPEGKAMKAYKIQHKRSGTKKSYKQWLDEQDQLEGWGPTKKSMPSEDTLMGKLYNYVKKDLLASNLPSYVQYTLLRTLFNVIKKSVFGGDVSEEYRDYCMKTPGFKKYLTDLLKPEHLSSLIGNPKEALNIIYGYINNEKEMVEHVNKNVMSKIRGILFSNNMLLTKDVVTEAVEFEIKKKIKNAYKKEKGIKKWTLENEDEVDERFNEHINDYLKPKQKKSKQVETIEYINPFSSK